MSSSVARIDWFIWERGILSPLALRRSYSEGKGGRFHLILTDYSVLEGWEEVGDSLWKGDVETKPGKEGGDREGKEGTEGGERGGEGGCWRKEGGG